VLAEHDDPNAGRHRNRRLLAPKNGAVAGRFQPRKQLVGRWTTGASFRSEQLHHHGLRGRGNRHQRENQEPNHCCTYSDAIPYLNVHRWYCYSLERFFGNSAVAAALSDMIRRERIPQTLLLSGPEGVGKATLARRFAADLVQYDAHKIDQ